MREIEEVIQDIYLAIKAEHALVKRIFVEAEPAMVGAILSEDLKIS